MVDQDLLLVDTDNNTNAATSDLGQSHSYLLIMLKPLVYIIKTQQVGSHDSTLPPSTPDLGGHVATISSHQSHWCILSRDNR